MAILEYVPVVLALIVVAFRLTMHTPRSTGSKAPK
jgi:hypothetical protein